MKELVSGRRLLLCVESATLEDGHLKCKKSGFGLELVHL